MGREKTTTSQPTTKQKRLCKNCGRPATSKRSRCSGCYKYWKVHHTERPERFYNRILIGDRGGKQAGWCEVCGNTKVHTSGKCATCYDRWVKGKPRRSRWLWDDDYRCKTCRIPLKSLGHYKNGKRRQVKGYCVACYKYKRRTGEPRPRYLWGIGPHGWCECGRPAVDLVDGDILVCDRHREIF